MADQVSAILNDVTGNLFLILLTSSNNDHYSMILSGNGSGFICNCWRGSARQKNIQQYTIMYRQYVIKITFFFPLKTESCSTYALFAEQT